MQTVLLTQSFNMEQEEEESHMSIQTFSDVKFKSPELLLYIMPYITCTAVLYSIIETIPIEL